MPRPSSPLSDSLPPLIFGTGTFNYQYNVDPYALGPTAIVQKALGHGIRAFDTSPYYGPAEDILGTALASSEISRDYSRDQYLILTKVGRIASDVFDYSTDWVRFSVQRSCQRLRTDYLDVVYCHDVEFVTPAEVLTAVRELRRIRDEDGTLKYVGISGYPVHVLCELAEMILRETGEPLDIVQSYANYTIQNTRLISEGLQRLVNAGVDVVTNASPLGMGLLRRNGPPLGAMGNWHPAPDDLRQACIDAAKWAEDRGERLEVVALRYAFENWLREGAKAGCYGTAPGLTNASHDASLSLPREKLGVSVMGVSRIEELDEIMRVWRSVLDGLADDLEAEPGTVTPSNAVTDHEWSLQRRKTIRALAEGIRKVIGPKWVDFAWPSPGPGYVNQLKKTVASEKDKAGVVCSVVEVQAAALLTPQSEAENDELMQAVPALPSVA